MIYFRGKFLLMMRYVGMTKEYELHLLNTILYREIMKLGHDCTFHDCDNVQNVVVGIYILHKSSNFNGKLLHHTMARANTL